MITLINQNGYYIRVSQNRPPTHQEYIEKVADEISRISCIPLPILRSKTRVREVVLWRQLAMYINYTSNLGTLKSIGLFYGGRDHSTVIHAAQTIQDLIDSKDRGLMVCMAKLSPDLFIKPKPVYRKYVKQS